MWLRFLSEAAKRQNAFLKHSVEDGCFYRKPSKCEDFELLFGGAIVSLYTNFLRKNAHWLWTNELVGKREVDLPLIA